MHGMHGSKNTRAALSRWVRHWVKPSALQKRVSKTRVTTWEHGRWFVQVHMMRRPECSSIILTSWYFRVSVWKSWSVCQFRLRCDNKDDDRDSNIVICRYLRRLTMPRTITISLPVADLKVSKAFYTALGFVNNPQFSSDDG